MSRYNMLIGKLNLEGCVRQSLNDNTFKFDCVLRQKNPSVLYKTLVKFLSLCQNVSSTSVKINTPSLVTATVFS